MSEDTNDYPNDESVVIEETKRHKTRTPIFAAIAVTGAVIAGALVIWYLRSRDEGSVVTAPSTVTFGDAANSQGFDPSVEQSVRLQPEQAEKIGLKIETVGEELSGEAMSVAATGVVEPNAYKETPVILLVRGVVKKMNVELGQTVTAGQTVAVVSSDEVAAAAASFLSMIAEAEEADKRYERALKLADIAEESRNELDQATAAVNIVEAEHAEHVSHYRRAEKLLEIGAISRQEFESVRSMHETAKAKLTEATNRLERARKLLEINPQRRAELDAALRMKRSADANVSSMREKLMVYGLTARQADQIRLTRTTPSELPLVAPVTGTVTKRMANVGEIIEANKEIMRVTDLSNVWAIAQVYERDLTKIRVGSGASVSSDSLPGRIFRGHVAYIDPNIAPETRTAQVRIELENPGQVIRLGLYVNVAFGSLGDAEKTMPVIPSAAVQNMNGRQVVFVPTTDPNVFAIRPVRLGSEANGRFPVLEGLTVGDRVVSDGSFLLRAEFLKLNPATN